MDVNPASNALRHLIAINDDDDDDDGGRFSVEKGATKWLLMHSTPALYTATVGPGLCAHRRSVQVPLPRPVRVSDYGRSGANDGIMA